MLLNDLAGYVDPSSAEPVVRRQFDLWLEPELRLAAGVLHMYVRPELLAREEVEPVATYAENGRAHQPRIPDASFLSPICIDAWLVSIRACGPAT